MRAGVLIVLLLAGCRQRDLLPDGAGWHTQEVTECGVRVDLPAAASRSERTADGWRSITYSVRDGTELYLTDCIVVPESVDTTPADVVADQMRNHRSTTELGNLGTPITDSGVEPTADGGRYWFAFASGMRIEGVVHVNDHRVVDVSGSVAPDSPRSRAALERVLASYHHDVGL